MCVCVCVCVCVCMSTSLKMATTVAETCRRHTVLIV